MDKLLYTVAEVQELTGLGRWKLYDLIRNGSLRSVKLAPAGVSPPTRYATSLRPCRPRSRRQPARERRGDRGGRRPW